MVFPTSPITGLDLPREDVVKAYSLWQRSYVRMEEQKEYYDMAEESTLEHCYDLNMIAINQDRMYRFYN